MRDPRAETFEERFRPVSEEVVPREPDFNFRVFNSNAVLRWEWRPGSTLFLVWNSGIRDVRDDGSFELFRDLGQLFGTPGTNVLLMKASYWFEF